MERGKRFVQDMWCNDSVCALLIEPEKNINTDHPFLRWFLRIYSFDLIKEIRQDIIEYISKSVHI